jgi:hypothetical protein
MSDARVAVPDWIPFPATRPEIALERLPDTPEPLALEELPWWFAVPRPGCAGAWGTYDAPDWLVTSATSLHAARPAEVHGEACVEVAFVDADLDTDWAPRRGALYGRLTESRVEYLATAFEHGDKLVLRTFLDDGFDVDWGRFPRLVTSVAAFGRESELDLRLAPGVAAEGKVPLGDGLWRVRVGEREFECMRLLDVDPGSGTRGTLMEGYVDRNGRTVLCRRYNGTDWRRPSDPPPDWRPWDLRLPSAARLQVDGVTYVHWYDCLSASACGVAARFGPPV